MEKKITILLTVVSSLAWGRQDCGMSVRIVYPDSQPQRRPQCYSSGVSGKSSGISVRIVYPENSSQQCNFQYSPNSCNYESQSVRDEKLNEKKLARERILAATRELERREREAAEAAERERVRKFLEDQKQVQVPPEKDEFRRWKILREISQERNAFAEWKEVHWKKESPKKDTFKEENESFIRILEKTKKEAKERQKEDDEDGE